MVHTPVRCTAQQQAQIIETGLEAIQHSGDDRLLIGAEPLGPRTGHKSEMISQAVRVRRRPFQKPHQHRDIVGALNRQRFHAGHRLDRHRHSRARPGGG